jgi:hypothetical protein
MGLQSLVIDYCTYAAVPEHRGVVGGEEEEEEVRLMGWEPAPDEGTKVT